MTRHLLGRCGERAADLAATSALTGGTALAPLRTDLWIALQEAEPLQLGEEVIDVSDA